MRVRRNQGQAPDEFYHLYNRGVLKREIFHDQYDWARFLFSLLFFQSSKVAFDDPSRHVRSFFHQGEFAVDPDKINQLLSQRDVELIAFCLRPNHFHLLVTEIQEGGIAKYLQRLGNSYTKYHNIKYASSGHLFQGSYQSVLMTDNEQLLYTSAYIHNHKPRLDFPWSSYQDYIKENRWPRLLASSIVLDQFANTQEYQEWLRDSGAKEDRQHRMLTVEDVL